MVQRIEVLYPDNVCDISALLSFDPCIFPIENNNSYMKRIHGSK